MCTRALYVGDGPGPEDSQGNLIITGRSMDWGEDMVSNMWSFPRGMARDGASGTDTISWTSKYGSLAISVYELAVADGMNEAGLAMNAFI